MSLVAYDARGSPAPIHYPTTRHLRCAPAYWRIVAAAAASRAVSNVVAGNGGVTAAWYQCIVSAMAASSISNDKQCAGHCGVSGLLNGLGVMASLSQWPILNGVFALYLKNGSPHQCGSWLQL